MAGGRPTDYNEEILLKAQEYISSCEDTDIEGGKVNVKIPTRGGLARYLDVSRDTLYEWAKVHKEFSYIMETLGAEQEDRLINQGLSGRYNSTISKVLLTKHGYADKLETDITTQGEKLSTDTVINDLTVKLNEVFRSPSLSSDGGTPSPLGSETPDKE